MATPLELAKAAEERKLRMSGMQNTPPPPGDSDLPPDDDLPLDDDLPPLDDDITPPGDNDRVAKLERDFRAMTERVAPLQRQSEQMRDLWQQERIARETEKARYEAEMQALRDQLSNKQFDDIDISDALSEEELEMLDPEMAKLLTKLTKTAVKRMTPNVDIKGEVARVLQEQEAQRVSDYRRRILVDPKKGLHKLAELSYNPTFATWAKDTGMESFVASLMSSTNTEEVDRFAKIIASKLNDWHVEAKGGKKAPEANSKPAVGNYMRRQSQGSLSEKEIAEKTDEIKRLARSRNPADRKQAHALMQELETAR